MAGILNNKERVMDFAITQEGKRQAGIGEMRIRYATFTDLHTFYETSGSLEIPKLAADASDRIFFETYNRYQDVIVPELEAGYSLRPFRTKDFEVVGGTLTSGTVNTGISNHPNILSGSELSSNIGTVLNGITQNFTDQRIVGSIDEFSLYQNVIVTPTTGTFKLSNTTQFLRASSATQKTLLEEIPSLFSDRRFADFPNFKFLPPVNRPRPGDTEKQPIGNYPRLNEQEIISLDELEQSLVGKQKVDFQFSETSRSNNLVVQFFEQDTSGVEKLSVVDFGEFEDDDPNSPGKRVLYIGKVVRDGFGSETFLCIFTVVID